MITGGAAAVLGFTVLPRQRRRAIRDFQDRSRREIAVEIANIKTEMTTII